MRFDVVVNPEGASGRTGRTFREKLLPAMKESGQEIHVHYSTREKGIEEIVRELCGHTEENDGGILNLIIIGGDGTLNEAVNGIKDLSKTHLGYLPAGSGNDFAKAVEIGTDKISTLKQILTGKVRRELDVGEVHFTNPEFEKSEDIDRYSQQSTGKADEGSTDISAASHDNDIDTITRRFNVSCGMGFDAAICHEAAVTPLKGGLNRLHLGKLIYVLCAAKLIFTTRKYPIRVTLTTPEGTQEADYDSCLFALAMNTKYEGGGFQFCPQARSGDGILDTCIGVTRHNMVFFFAFPFIYGGHHTKMPVFRISKANTVRFQSREPLWIHTDGEVHCKAADITIRLLPQRLQLLN